ncbi:hypothetical protein CERSUDRAFT_67258 [Gelatoporia subvermispora B]|uniref:Ubiquitin 3 binding protein But2 C-terminal domain-containing protein n=1 Tax=Ceriporiopsis subvermispora (strain B) TaxID=914234 RepID=M2R859_CERS8|nr:hypothetical protein CERSUDRAFT_67258 [Gelatoporia subvermispora B]
MLAFSFLFAALAIPTALAGSALRLRQSGCKGSIPGKIDTASNITINALDSDAANSGGQGLPLVALVATIGGVETTYVLATQATASTLVGSTTFADFSLQNDILAPIIPNTFSANLAVQPGLIIEFASGQIGQAIPEEFCGIANTDPAGGGISEPLLSVNGDTSDFALCMSGPIGVIVFQPNADNSGEYDIDSCTSVDILIFEH